MDKPLVLEIADYNVGVSFIQTQCFTGSNALVVLIGWGPILEIDNDNNFNQGACPILWDSEVIQPAVVPLLSFLTSPVGL